MRVPSGATAKSKPCVFVSYTPTTCRQCGLSSCVIGPLDRWPVHMRVSSIALLLAAGIVLCAPPTTHGTCASMLVDHTKDHVCCIVNSYQPPHCVDHPYYPQALNRWQCAWSSLHQMLQSLQVAADSSSYGQQPHLHSTAMRYAKGRTINPCGRDDLRRLFTLTTACPPHKQHSNHRSMGSQISF